MFYPSYYYDSVFHIPYDLLYAQGVRCLVYDIDNTLAGHDELQPSSKVKELFKRLQAIGFKLALISNNNAKRVQAFNESLGLICESKAAKPLTNAMRRVMGKLETDESKTVIIGDQIFTDVWCGNNIGCMSILVKPLTVKDVLIVKVKRGIERLVVNSYIRKRVYRL